MSPKVDPLPGAALRPRIGVQVLASEFNSRLTRLLLLF